MSLPPPEPNPVDAALAAYIEQKIEKRLEARARVIARRGTRILREVARVKTPDDAARRFDGALRRNHGA